MFRNVKLVIDQLFVSYRYAVEAPADYVKEKRLTVGKVGRLLSNKPHDNYSYLSTVQDLIRGTNQSLSKSEVNLISNQVNKQCNVLRALYILLDMLIFQLHAACQVTLKQCQ